MPQLEKLVDQRRKEMVELVDRRLVGTGYDAGEEDVFGKKVQMGGNIEANQVYRAK